VRSYAIEELSGPDAVLIVDETGFVKKGKRLYDWALLRLAEQDGWVRSLLVRRSIEEKPECAYYLCYAPTGKDAI
jgi:hypothetical protein